MGAIETSRPELRISTKAAKLNIRQARPEFTVRHKRPKMEIRKRVPQFKISRSYSSAGTNKSAAIQISRRFIRVLPSRAPNFMEKLVAESVVQEGFDMEALQLNEADETALQMIAAENEKGAEVPDPVSLEWDKGAFEIEWTKGIMEIDWDVTTPEIFVEPCDIKIYVMNNIKKNVELSASARTGAKVDKKI